MAAPPIRPETHDSNDEERLVEHRSQRDCSQSEHGGEAQTGPFHQEGSDDDESGGESVSYCFGPFFSSKGVERPFCCLTVQERFVAHCPD